MAAIKIDTDKMYFGAQELNDYFNKINDSFDDLLSSYKQLKSGSIWDSPALEYFIALTSVIESNRNVIKKRINDINKYLENVINNADGF